MKIRTLHSCITRYGWESQSDGICLYLTKAPSPFLSSALVLFVCGKIIDNPTLILFFGHFIAPSPYYPCIQWFHALHVIKVLELLLRLISLSLALAPFGVLRLEIGDFFAALALLACRHTNSGPSLLCSWAMTSTCWMIST